MTAPPHFRFTREPLSGLNSALRKELGDKLAHKHDLEGAWSRDATGCPVIAMSADSIAGSSVGSKALYTLRRGGLPGFRIVGFMTEYAMRFGHLNTLTVGIEVVQEGKILSVARFCAPIQPVWLELFESPPLS